MSRSLLHLLVAGTMAVSAVASATADEPVRIAPFKGNKTAAVSYTFDDGLRDQYTVAAPILEKLEIPATFFIIPGKVAKSADELAAKKAGEWGGVTWDEVRSLAAKGFEIGNHSLTHPNLTKTDDTQLEEQVEVSADLLQKETGIFPVSFCFPYNAHDERVDREVYKHHAVARTFQRAFGKKDQSVDGLNQWIDTLIAKGDWGVTMIHGLIEGFDSPLDPQMFEQHLAYAKGRQPHLWIDTFGNVGRYVKEAKSAKVRIIEKSANSVTFALDSELDPKLFNVPLTVIISAPGAAKDEVLAECVPDGKPVTIKW
jgi:peptidoglycan/xylan/chitin deacetylase (PgdA/CDA1 family)